MLRITCFELLLFFPLFCNNDPSTKKYNAQFQKTIVEDETSALHTQVATRRSYQNIK